MGALMYVREVAEKVRPLDGDVTLFGKRNFTSFEGEQFDLIFYSLPIKCPREIVDGDDIAIPMIESKWFFENPSSEVLKFDRRELRDGIFSYNSFGGKFKPAGSSLLRFILLNEFQGGFGITKLSSSEVNEDTLRSHEYFKEIQYLRKDFNLNYTGCLNFPRKS